MNQTSRLTDQRNIWKKRALMNLLAGLKAMEAMGHKDDLRKVTDCLALLQQQRLSIAQLELEVEKALTAKSMAPERTQAKAPERTRAKAPETRAKASKPAPSQGNRPDARQHGPSKQKQQPKQQPKQPQQKQKKTGREESRGERRMLRSAEAFARPA